MKAPLWQRHGLLYQRRMQAGIATHVTQPMGSGRATKALFKLLPPLSQPNRDGLRMLVDRVANGTVATDQVGPFWVIAAGPGFVAISRKPPENHS